MIRIITDSTADLLPERVEALGIEILPLSVHFGEEVWLDGVTLSHREFYDKLAAAEQLPTTAQISPDTFLRTFEKYLAAGDQVLGIFLSSDLSGTYQSACIARDMTGSKDVAVIDSRTVTFAMGLLVEQACILRDRGLSLAKLTEQVTELTSRIRLIAAVDTLKYLKMGGRILAASAVVGGLLGISPIIAVQNGRVESIGKTRGRKAALAWLREELGRRPADLSLPVSFGHSNAPAILEETMAAFADWSAAAPLTFSGDIGCVVGTHVGPKACGLAYFEQN